MTTRKRLEGIGEFGSVDETNGFGLEIKKLGPILNTRSGEPLLELLS